MEWVECKPNCQEHGEIGYKSLSGCCRFGKKKAKEHTDRAARYTLLRWEVTLLFQDQSTQIHIHSGSGGSYVSLRNQVNAGAIEKEVQEDQNINRGCWKVSPLKVSSLLRRSAIPLLPPESLPSHFYSYSTLRAIIGSLSSYIFDSARTFASSR